MNSPQRTSTALLHAASAALLLTLAPLRAHAQETPPDATFTVSRETTAITQPIHADGTIDYVAAINAKYGQGVTPQNNAFVTWLQISGTEQGFFAEKTEDAVLKMCGALPTRRGTPIWEDLTFYLIRTKPGINGAPLDAADQELTDAGKAPWKPQDHPDIAAYLKEEAPFLAIAQQAAQQPKWWAPSVAGDGRFMGTVTLYSVGLIRSVTNVLCAQAMLDAGTGNMDAAISEITSVRKLARLLGSGVTEIERLVALALENQADDAFATLAASGLLSEPQCIAAANTFDHMPPMPSLADSLDTDERWSELDTVVGVIIGRLQAIDAADPQSDPESPSNMFRTVDRASVDWDVVLKRVNHFYDDQLAALRLSTYQEIEAHVAASQKQLDAWHQEAEPAPAIFNFSRAANETPQAYTDRIGRAVIGLLSSDFGRAAELQQRSLLEAQMARATAAQFHAKNGRWPAQLQELVPQMLARIPQDFYSAKGTDVVKYKLTPTGPRVYSVGRNGIDDGGIRNPDKKFDDIGVGAVIRDP